MRRAAGLGAAPGLALVLALAVPAAAQNATIAAPPAPGTPTSNLVLDAMLATARAAALHQPGTQSASLNTNAALLRYQAGDLEGARNAALQALIDANRNLPTAVPALPSTIPQTSALKTNPFPIAPGAVSDVDANAFVAQARGAVGACASRNSPNTPAATRALDAAQRALRAGRYNDARAQARTAIDLCAAAQAQINAGP